MLPAILRTFSSAPIRLITVFSAAALALAACSSSSGSHGTANGPGDSSTSPNVSSSNTTTAAAAAAANGSTLSSQDRDYLTKSAQGDKFEVLGGQAAQTKTTVMVVRTFGQRMVSDHSKSFEELAQAAPSLGFTAPTTPDSTQQKTLALMSQLSGTTFACSYLMTEYNDHEADVAMTKLEIASGQSPQVKQMAQKELPTLEQHLSMAQSALENTTRCS